MPDLPQELLDALERGELTRDQLMELISLEAEGLELSVDEAIRLAAEGLLPRSPLGLDLASLIDLLKETPAAA